MRRYFRLSAIVGAAARLLASAVLIAGIEAIARPARAESESPALAGHSELLRTSAFGAYLGYPAMAGLQIAAPVDGPFGFRSGLAGLPAVGIVWTPGIELRFDQEAGTYSRDSYYGFANLFLARYYVNRDRDFLGMETGLGYRWMLSDRRALRWVAGMEVGGYWDDDSPWPDRPSLRVYWLLAGH